MNKIENNPSPATTEERQGEETAATKASRKLLSNHLNSFLDNNIKALMEDYTEESVLVTQTTSYKGLDEIASFFYELVVHFPKSHSQFKLDKIVVDDDLAFIVWQAETPSLSVSLGSDTFIIKNGKISQQTFVGQLQYVGTV